MIWDTWKNQDRLLREIDGKTRYMREHQYRLKVGQANGSQTMAGMLKGEIALMDALLGGGEYSTPKKVIDRLNELSASPPSHLDDDAKRGWEIAIRSELSSMARYLPPTDLS